VRDADKEFLLWMLIALGLILLLRGCHFEIHVTQPKCSAAYYQHGGVACPDEAASTPQISSGEKEKK
jgi:hypothetical protein